MTWSTTPQALAILIRLSPDDMGVSLNKPIVGDDYLELALRDEDTHETLEAVRHLAVNEAFGMTFSEAQDAGCAREFLDFYATVPTVADVLAERFGDPRKFGRTDPYTATLLWRAEAKAAADRSLAA